VGLGGGALGLGEEFEDEVAAGGCESFRRGGRQPLVDGETVGCVDQAYDGWAAASDVVDFVEDSVEILRPSLADFADAFVPVRPSTTPAVAAVLKSL